MHVNDMIYCAKLTQSFSSVNATAHAKHAIHARCKRSKALGDDAEILGPGGDVVVETIIADGDAIDSSVDLKFPSRLLDLVGDSEKIIGGDVVAPKFLEDELELTVFTHAAEAKR